MYVVGLVFDPAERERIKKDWKQDVLPVDELLENMEKLVKDPMFLAVWVNEHMEEYLDKESV